MNRNTMNTRAVAANTDGAIVDCPDLAACGRSGRLITPLDKASLITLPRGSRLFLLPGRSAVGFGSDGKIVEVDPQYTAVAAFLPPGYTAISLAAFSRRENAPVLPLFSYCAVCWHNDAFHVPAIRVDCDPKHDPTCFDRKEVRKQIQRLFKRFPHNRLLAHHGNVCALQYECPNAANLFLRRWEAPVAVSGACNAACQGCISEQRSSTVVSPQKRIGFVPTVKEIVEIAVPHLERAPNAMISFGQGCEGEPLLRAGLIADSIREIRRRTNRGAININTNGSRPESVRKLIAAGLDSIRVSLNSARERLYTAYYCCRDYSFADVLTTLAVSRDAGIWTSLNYLTFPGVTDDPQEYAAFAELLAEYRPEMIQWRNLNIDPDWYMDIVGTVFPDAGSQPIGLPNLMAGIKADFPAIRHGYFNPAPASSNK